MILREISFERFIFTCTGCEHAWEVDYEVQHVEDGHGHERDYYFRQQLHYPDPTGPGETTCPHCGRSLVSVRHGERRTSPAADGVCPEEPGAASTPTLATVPGR